MKQSGSSWKNNSDDTRRACGKRRRLGSRDRGWLQPGGAVSRAGFALAPMWPLQKKPLPSICREQGLLLTLLRGLTDGDPRTKTAPACPGVNSDYKRYAEQWDAC